jgi:hypothetical protein
LANWLILGPFQPALADEARVPSSEDLESAIKFRRSGHFSDKNSDFLGPAGAAAAARRSLHRALRRPRDSKEEMEQMQGDDPYAGGQIFSLGGFSQEAVQPGSGREQPVSKEQGAVETAYLRKPYIQLYNALSKLQMEVRTGGAVKVTNDIITKNCEYSHPFSPRHEFPFRV